MKVLLVVIILMALVYADHIEGSTDNEFQNWKQKFDKHYNSNQEESQHKEIWIENYKLVQKHNKEFDNGIKSYRLGMNYFADMSNQEFKEFMSKSCLLYLNTTKSHSSATLIQHAEADLPKTVNWREKGYVTEVSDQKNCGSCWAFSATGALEGQVSKMTGKLVSLSKQQLIDCSRRFGNRGCEGGSMDWAFKYVQENGLNTEDSYPYEAMDGPCRFNPATIGARCTGYVDINIGDENYLQDAVANIGPISVAIDTTPNTFNLYESGVYDEAACSSSKLNHGVLVVGYGTDDEKDYWLVKNSWGPDWGDNGYIKMSRNKDNQCGIATKATYPLVSDKTQRVQYEACSIVFVLVYFLVDMFY